MTSENHMVRRNISTASNIKTKATAVFPVSVLTGSLAAPSTTIINPQALTCVDTLCLFHINLVLSSMSLFFKVK
uniref:Uncharacterized protein n=1 Tax=Romanomermis culicivorax TaxID=13658 RepID=A0A915IJT9_ROMCU